MLYSGLRTSPLQRVESILIKSIQERMRMEGKEEFYKKAEEALKKSGYQYYGEKDISVRVNQILKKWKGNKKGRLTATR